jgi:hypothetical protein
VCDLPHDDEQLEEGSESKEARRPHVGLARQDRTEPDRQQARVLERLELGVHTAAWLDVVNGAQVVGKVEDARREREHRVQPAPAAAQIGAVRTPR